MDQIQINSPEDALALVSEDVPEAQREQIATAIYDSARANAAWRQVQDPLTQATLAGTPPTQVPESASVEVAPPAPVTPATTPAAPAAADWQAQAEAAGWAPMTGTYPASGQGQDQAPAPTGPDTSSPTPETGA